MKNIIAFLFIIFLASVQVSNSQKITVNIEEIESFTETDAYDDLLSRYKDDDLNLTYDDYAKLYYGQAFAVDYNPYIKHDTIIALSEYLKKEPESIDYNLVLRYCNVILKKFPFRLETILICAVAYTEIGDEYGAEIWTAKYTGIVSAIMSSGDGVSPKSPLVVVSTSDEYVILNLLGLNFRGQSLLKKKKKWYDVISIGPNSSGRSRIYFDVSLIMK